MRWEYFLYSFISYRKQELINRTAPGNVTLQIFTVKHFQCVGKKIVWIFPYTIFQTNMRQIDFNLAKKRKKWKEIRSLLSTFYLIWFVEKKNIWTFHSINSSFNFTNLGYVICEKFIEFKVAWLIAPASFNFIKLI